MGRIGGRVPDVVDIAGLLADGIATRGILNSESKSRWVVYSGEEGEVE